MKRRRSAQSDVYSKPVGAVVALCVFGSYAAIVCITTLAGALTAIRGDRESEDDSSFE